MIRQLASGLGVAIAIGAISAAAQEPAPAPTQEPAPDQETDLTVPPTLEPAPGEPRLEAAPEQREDVLEAVVTSGQTEWRLPDLGTSLRKQREEEAKNSDQRIEVGFVGLYDPDEDDAGEDFLSPDAEVERGVGWLKIFDIRFGRRATD